METIKLYLPSKVSFSTCLAAVFVFAFCSTSSGADVFWTGQVNNDWDNVGNWFNNAAPADSDYVNIFSGGTVDFTSGTSPSLRGVRQSGGILNISGGRLEAANRTNSNSDFDGAVFQTGGFASINAVQIGSAPGAIGRFELSDGEFRIARGVSDTSLFLGGNRNGSAGGRGSFTVSGGLFVTRADVRLGHPTSAGIGVFNVLEFLTYWVLKPLKLELVQLAMTVTASGNRMLVQR